MKTRKEGKMPKTKNVRSTLSRVRAILHECEAILEDFQEGKRCRRLVSFASPEDSDPVRARKGVTTAIIEIDRLTAEIEGVDHA